MAGILDSLVSDDTPSSGNGLSLPFGGTNSLLQSLGLAQATAQSLNALPPWESVDPTRFFFPITIDGKRWNLAFPYRFVVIDTQNNNAIVNGPDFNAQVEIDAMDQGGVLAFEPLTPQWSIQLPITPEQLNITDQFSITTTATLRGVMEEHNGVKFKTISASGTFGVWPTRDNVVAPPSSPSILQSLFGGTIEAFGNLASSVQGVINTATTGHPASKPQSKQPAQTPDGIGATGYYQALAIQQFLEQYAEQKKDPANAGWRLVFDIPKQNQSFIVTPVQFQWQQNANKPMQINYSLQLKAWRRIDLKQSVVATPPSVNQLTPGILQRILNTLSAARTATSQALSLIAAVRSDVEAPLEALRQTSLLVKDLAGVVVTAADLPFQLQNDYKNAINTFFNSLSIGQLNPTLGNNGSAVGSLKAIQASNAQVEGLSLNAVSSGQLGNNATNAQAIDPSQNIYSNAAANFTLFDAAPVNQLQLTVPQQNAVNNAIQDARVLTVAQLKAFRATIQQLAVQLSNNFGTGSTFYNKVYGLPPPIVRSAPITLDSYALLQTLYDVMQSYDTLTATTQINDNNTQTNMEYVAGLADQSGIEFSIPNSKILAPVPFGLTIEAIAQRYLGDAQQWLSIATLNNLRDPYIDETGFQYYLLSNGNGRQVTVDTNQNLYLGQRVLIFSANQSPTARTILDIAELSATQFLITLDGLPNLDVYLTTDQAYLQAYLPGTVNSQQKIWIPSNTSVPDLPNIIAPASTSADPLTGMSMVDILLLDSGDVALNNFGDFRYSAGMTNLIQALKIKMGTVQNSVLLHPEFGLGVKPGTSNANVDAQQLYDSINKLIQQDPRFAGVQNLQIVLNGPVLTINMSVLLANGKGVFPIAFQLT